MKPSIGRIVIYNVTHEDQMRMSQLANGMHRTKKLPAIIVDVCTTDVIEKASEPPIVSLKVFTDGDGPNLYFPSALEAPEDDQDKPGTWYWPPRV